MRGAKDDPALFATAEAESRHGKPAPMCTDTVACPHCGQSKVLTHLPVLLPPYSYRLAADGLRDAGLCNRCGRHVGMVAITGGKWDIR